MIPIHLNPCRLFLKKILKGCNGQKSHIFVHYTIKRAYANAVPRYQSQGILGGRNWVEDCYQKSNYKLGCYHFDQLISNIDKSMAEYAGFPTDDYFSQSNVEHRALTYILDLKQLSSADFRKVVDDTITKLAQNSDLMQKYFK